jgi:hypothetical protein
MQAPYDAIQMSNRIGHSASAPFISLLNFLVAGYIALLTFQK